MTRCATYTMLNYGSVSSVQISCLQFFNELWRATRVMSTKVYVQCELEQAGFDPYKLEKVRGLGTMQLTVKYSPCYCVLTVIKFKCLYMGVSVICYSTLNLPVLLSECCSLRCWYRVIKSDGQVESWLCTPVCACSTIAGRSLSTRSCSERLTRGARTSSMWVGPRLNCTT